MLVAAMARKDGYLQLNEREYTRVTAMYVTWSGTRAVATATI